MDWERLTNDQIDETLTQFLGLTAASQAQVCELVREVDRRQQFLADGSRNLTDWLSARFSIRHKTARQLVSVARRLSDLPELSERFAAGEFSLDQVDAISRMATTDTEKGLIEEALGLSNTALDRKARRANPPTAGDERTVFDRRAMYLQWNLDESELNLRANLDAVGGEIVQKAVKDAANQIPVNPETGLFDAYSARMADGLIEVCATTGDQTSVSPPQVTVHADLEALITNDGGVTELGSGGLVPNETARRLACDCVVETVITDGHQTIGVGRNSRTVPGWLRRLVHHRDGGTCVFSGCDNSNWLQVHHIVHWSQGGPTDLDNLILLCGFHHRYLHEHGWHITTNKNNQFVFCKPDWTPYPPPKPDLHPRLKHLAQPRPT